ncbi:dynein heavy chain [Cryomyces antarcticus]|nr:dynein heavy chain [Cryomyces antarcticus]
MKESLSSLSMRATKQPAERARVYLLLAFLHAVIQERLRYAPNIGWKGFWEFNDSDLECSAFVIDTWIEFVAHGRTNVAPQKIPWEMIRFLVAETYGGKIDDEGDFRQLKRLVEEVLTSAAFEENYRIVKEVTNASSPDESLHGLTLPSETGWKEFVEWVDRLPEREPPTYLGLPANAEKLLLVGQAEELVGSVRLISNTLDEGEQFTFGDVE